MSDGNFVHEQLLSGRVSKVFLDSFQANALRKFLDHPEIVLDSIHNAKASYGVLLSGDAKRISKCVKKYVSENEQRLFERIAQSTTSFKVFFLIINFLHLSMGGDALSHTSFLQSSLEMYLSTK